MSNISQGMASPRALREWCRATCACYPNVEITNMTTSFRDGLAFCAIIHKHRPDLLEFRSLSKENIYQNNKLAFEVAETKLGIPALLDPKDMVSTKVPDCLSILTYLSQYYHFFNRKSYAGLPSLRSSHVTALNNLEISKTPEDVKPLKTSTDLETIREDRLSNTRPRTVCNLCFKPIHLIQRHLIDGKIYHRSCFRCKVCRSTLLHGSYTRGSDAGSLICTLHVTDRKIIRVQLNQQTESTENQSERRKSSTGSSTQANVGLFCSRCSCIRDIRDQSLPDNKQLPCCSPTSDRPKVNIKHPWLTIIHPGPWTQLPRAPPPLPKSVYSTQNAWYRPKERPQNPFREEEEEEEEEERPDKPNPPKNPDFRGAAGVADTVGASSEPVGDTSQIGTSELDETGNTGGSLVKQTEAAAAAAAGPHGFSDEAQGHVLSRSLSVPAITSARDQSSFLLHDMTEANESDQVISCQSKAACRENPFDRKPAMVKSKSFQTLSSKQASAPGHGFPLIKRKVQTEQDVSTEGLQMEMSELDKHLEALEQRGVQLERNLRDSQNEKEEGQMLMEWFSLFYNRHVLMRKATELVHLTKQQKLEERQADVEYELRCLLNKPDGDWSQEDREQEQQMMDELVAIIDQRNQIISSLDQDRQREREECVLLEAMNKNKEVQKEGLKELKKSKGKFNPTTVFKMLNHKTRSTKDSVEKNT
ncbi:MICAL-like protein 1 [Pempheris klunzingeri]|uniref:MICAL-like protein 1 n=1 Tax=Pempheris klunzingeri TaxID=3127111 RepID=UPI003980A104